MLIVYVDDFKLTGSKPILSTVWGLIRKGLRIGDPTPVGLYLGCHHRVTEEKHPLSHKAVRVYAMT